MGRLTDSPSGGHSEVLDTLLYQGAIASGVQIFRLGPMVSHRWHADEDREGSDPTYEADVLTILAALETAGYVVGQRDSDGAAVSLQSSPALTTRIVLTGAGRVAARAPRPRPLADPYRGCC